MVLTDLLEKGKEKLTLIERINHIGKVVTRIVCLYTMFAILYTPYQIITNKKYEESYNGKIVDASVSYDNASIVIEDEHGNRKMLPNCVGMSAPEKLIKGDTIEANVTYIDPVRLWPIFRPKEDKEILRIKWKINGYSPWYRQKGDESGGDVYAPPVIVG